MSLPLLAAGYLYGNFLYFPQRRGIYPIGTSLRNSRTGCADAGLRPVVICCANNSKGLPRGSPLKNRIPILQDGIMIPMPDIVFLNP